ncbi:MAG: YfcE family phosphodiesterase [Flavobacteriales bacterium]|nr:YfcE family phosphodiesterase [Flavobacteriales bacterium]|tara:strand:+ start:35328 stop:35846 length:519 start_codon:yes stop_codon:yes gene_type:complete
MKRIAIISDTHGYLDNQIMKKFNSCDEIWHAGDFGYNDKIDGFIKDYKVKGVYGNIDGHQIRNLYPKINKFIYEGIKVLMTHIGGYPKKYNTQIREEIRLYKPDLFISGHSHILKVIYDNKYNVLHINPGAAGKEGFHQIRTLVILQIKNKEMLNIEVIELGHKTTKFTSID